MPEIRNSREIAEDMARGTREAAEGVEWRAGNVRACYNVRAESACDSCSERTGRLTEKVKEHVKNAEGFMEEVNQTLDTADKRAAEGNRNIQSKLSGGGQHS